jgi:hypothetical protein
MSVSELDVSSEATEGVVALASCGRSTWDALAELVALLFVGGEVIFLRRWTEN